MARGDGKPQRLRKSEPPKPPARGRGEKPPATGDPGSGTHKHYATKTVKGVQVRDWGSWKSCTCPIGDEHD